MKIAKTARPRMRPPLPFSKEKAESSASVISVPETSARPSPASEQDQDVDVAQRAAADDRVGDQRQAEQQPGGAERRQLGGEDVCRGDHGPLEDRAATAHARATPASGKTSVISTSLRRGAAREAAPTSGDEDDRGRHRDQLPPPAAHREQGEAGRGRGRRSAPGSPGRRSPLIASPTPPLHIRQTLRAVIAA